MVEKSTLFVDPGFRQGETLILQKRSEGRTFRITSRIEILGRDDETHYRVLVEEEASTSVLEIERGSLASLSLEKKDLQGNVLKKTVFSKDGITLSGGIKGIEKKFRPGPNIYDQDSVYYLLRGFPFGQNQGIELGLLQHEQGGVAPVRIQEAGQERVGERDCYKLEMRISGWVGLLWPYPYYFWFDKNSTHPFVKYQGMTGNKKEIETIELIEYQEGKNEVI